MSKNKKKENLKKMMVAGIAVASAMQTVPASAIPKGHVTSWQENKANYEQQKVDNANGNYYGKGTSDKGTFIVFSKGEVANTDKNQETHRDISNPDGTGFYRYTDDNGNPFTGLYNNRGLSWIVLDENGFYQRTGNKVQYAWLNEYLSADFLGRQGVSLNPDDGLYYGNNETIYNDALFRYLVFNDWVRNGPTYYRTNEKGVAYRNQWWKDESSGKWYYFGDDCAMVRNQYIGGYWIGADGSWQ